MPRPSYDGRGIVRQSDYRFVDGSTDLALACFQRLRLIVKQARVSRRSTQTVTVIVVGTEGRRVMRTDAVGVRQPDARPVRITMAPYT